MSLEFYIVSPDDNDQLSVNVSHNLRQMAEAAGLYDPMWDGGDRTPKQLAPLIRAGINRLIDDPDYFRSFEPDSWGTYEELLQAAILCFQGCNKYSDGCIVISR